MNGNQKKLIFLPTIFCLVAIPIFIIIKRGKKPKGLPRPAPIVKEEVPYGEVVMEFSPTAIEICKGKEKEVALILNPKMQGKGVTVATAELNFDFDKKIINIPFIIAEIELFFRIPPSKKNLFFH